MLDRQQRDELIAGLQSVKELWTDTASISAIQSNIIMEVLRVADDVCSKGLSAARYVFYQELFQVLIGIVEPQVWQNLSQDERQETKQLGLEVLNSCIDALAGEKEIKKEIVFLPYKASMWDSLESIWQAAYEDKEHCNTYVVPIPYADKNPDGTVAEWHCEADSFPDYVPVLDWHEYTLEKLRVMQPDVIFFHNPYDHANKITSVEPQYFSYKLKTCTKKLVYIPYYVSGERVGADKCQELGVCFADYVVVQDENIKAQYEANYPLGKAPEGKFLALGSPKFDKVLTSERADFVLPEEWKRIIQGKKVVLYNTSIKAALADSDMVCRKLRYVFGVFKDRDDVALWWRPHPLMEATFRSMRPEFYAEYEQIVAEYKQAGWGIYDDTPDANMAITYSDCYYGDNSSVLVTYRAAGRPIMLEDMRIQSETKRLLEVSYVCYEAGCLWFLTNEKNNTVLLFKFDIGNNRLDYVFSFHDEQANGTHSHMCLSKSGNKIIIAPFHSNGDFIEYDICTQEYKKKPLPCDFLELEENQVNEVFEDTVTYGNSIYFISGTRMAMVKYAKDTGVYTCKKIMLEEKELNVNEWRLYLQSTAIWDDKLFIAMADGNKILEYSFSSEEAVVHVAHFAAAFAYICRVNKKLYINQHNSFDIVVFDLTDYTWRKILIATDEKSEWPFIGCISLPKGILCMPYLASFKLLLGVDNVSSVEHIASAENIVRYSVVATAFADRKAFAINPYNAVLEVYDIASGNKFEYDLQCEDARLSKEIFSLKYDDIKGVILKENKVALPSLIECINGISEKNECIVNKGMLSGYKIYEVLCGNA